MLLLQKTEHPNITKYLWASKNKGLQVPKDCMSEEYAAMLTDNTRR